MGCNVIQALAKATRSLDVLKQNLKSTREVRERAYKSLVRPQVEYSAPVCSPWLAKDKVQLERVQCWAACYVCNTYSRHSSVTDMLNRLEWESVESHRTTVHLYMFYKAYYNLAVFPLLDYASLATTCTHGHNIRFLVPHCNKDIYRYSFLPSTIRAWNALPLESVEASTLEQFKASLPAAKY